MDGGMNIITEAGGCTMSENDAYQFHGDDQGTVDSRSLDAYAAPDHAYQPGNTPCGATLYHADMLCYFVACRHCWSTLAQLGVACTKTTYE